MVWKASRQVNSKTKFACPQFRVPSFDAWVIPQSGEVREDREELKSDLDSDSITHFARNTGVAVNDVSGENPAIERVYASFSFRDDSESPDRDLEDEALTFDDDDSWVGPVDIPTNYVPTGTPGEELLDVTYRFSGRPRFVRSITIEPLQIPPASHTSLVSNTELIFDRHAAWNIFPRLVTNAGNETDIFVLMSEDVSDVAVDTLTLTHIDP